MCLDPTRRRNAWKCFKMIHLPPQWQLDILRMDFGGLPTCTRLDMPLSVFKPPGAVHDGLEDKFVWKLSLSMSARVTDKYISELIFVIVRIQIYWVSWYHILVPRVFDSGQWGSKNTSLRQLNEFKKEGLVDEDEYKTQKAEIMRKMGLKWVSMGEVSSHVGTRPNHLKNV